MPSVILSLVFYLFSLPLANTNPNRPSLPHALVCSGPLPGDTSVLGDWPGVGRTARWTKADFSHSLQQFCAMNGYSVVNMGGSCIYNPLDFNNALVRASAQLGRLIFTPRTLAPLPAKMRMVFDISLAEEQGLFLPEYLVYCIEHCECETGPVYSFVSWMVKNKLNPVKDLGLRRGENRNRQEETVDDINEELRRAASRYNLPVPTISLDSDFDPPIMVPTAAPRNLGLSLARPGGQRAGQCSSTCDSDFRCSVSQSRGTANVDPGQRRQCVCAARRVTQQSFTVGGCRLQATRGNPWGKRDIVFEDGEEMACPCNATYVSAGCCASHEGWIWEPPEARLGSLILE